MPDAFRTSRRVEFADTDMAGIAHFSVFFRYMEEAEHALLRHLGLSVVTPEGDGHISWPRVSATCDFEASATFEDVLEILVQVERVGDTSVTYVFMFLTGDRQIAQGRMTSVCCWIHPGARPKSVTIPETFAAKLRTMLIG
jgi:4-hydroxybenzoyl-CoA thioesterase/acyl-CoA thioester hydrolase